MRDEDYINTAWEKVKINIKKRPYEAVGTRNIGRNTRTSLHYSFDRKLKQSLKKRKSRNSPTGNYEHQICIESINESKTKPQL